MRDILTAIELYNAEDEKVAAASGRRRGGKVMSWTNE